MMRITGANGRSEGGRVGRKRNSEVAAWPGFDLLADGG